MAAPSYNRTKAVCLALQYLLAQPAVRQNAERRYTSGVLQALKELSPEGQQYCGIKCDLNLLNYHRKLVDTAKSLLATLTNSPKQELAPNQKALFNNIAEGLEAQGIALTDDERPQGAAGKSYLIIFAADDPCYASGLRRMIEDKSLQIHEPRCLNTVAAINEAIRRQKFSPSQEKARRAFVDDKSAYFFPLAETGDATTELVQAILDLAKIASNKRKHGEDGIWANKFRAIADTASNCWTDVLSNACQIAAFNIGGGVSLMPVSFQAATQSSFERNFLQSCAQAGLTLVLVAGMSLVVAEEFQDDEGQQDAHDQFAAHNQFMDYMPPMMQHFNLVAMLDMRNFAVSSPTVIGLKADDDYRCFSNDCMLDLERGKQRLCNIRAERYRQFMSMQHQSDPDSKVQLGNEHNQLSWIVCQSPDWHLWIDYA